MLDIKSLTVRSSKDICDRENVFAPLRSRPPQPPPRRAVPLHGVT